MTQKQIKRLITKTVKVVLGVVICISILLILVYSETHYTRTGFVKRKALTPNDYYFYDSTGNVWVFSTDEKLNSDMNIEVKMYNNCTINNIKYDMIIDYQILSSELKIEIEK